MGWASTLLFVALGASCFKQGSGQFETCKRRYSKVGCFKESAIKVHLSKLLVNARVEKNQLIWDRFYESLHSLACRCEAKARELNYEYFSIRFYGECWVGNGASDLVKEAAAQSDTCVSHTYGKCDDSAAEECAGIAHSDYLYKLESLAVDGGYTKWKETSSCSKSCGGGVVEWRRECTNPAPSHGGKPCMGPAALERPCNSHPCPAERTFQYRTLCRGKFGSILSCDVGALINIVEATYGREDNRYCSGMGGLETTCEAKSVLPIVKAECQGKRDCVLTGSDGMYGGHCPGITKYLKVKYECVPIPSKYKVICQDSSDFIDCSIGSLPVIVEATYGRESADHCKQGELSSSKCKGDFVTTEVSRICNNQRNCTLTASSKVFGDPCPGISKYLAIEYKCQPGALHIKRVCQNEGLVLQCEKNTKIKIRNAVYGRYSTAFCKKYNYQSDNCASDGALTTLASLCDGKNRCQVFNLPRVFKDTCPGIFKFMEAQFWCMPY